MLRKANTLARAIIKACASSSRDVVGLTGTALIAYGAWLVYEPAGYIVGGAMLLCAAILVPKVAAT